MPRDPFYNTRTWKRLRKIKLITDPICEYCGREAATEVDHVVSINNGGSPTDWSNLKSSGHDCHSRKTYYIERLGRDRVPVKGCNPDGTPLDPEHPWNRGTSVQGQGEIVRPDASGTRTQQTFAGANSKDRARAAKQS
jgi:5-methylcytosine-specific restriction enzyme A